MGCRRVTGELGHYSAAEGEGGNVVGFLRNHMRHFVVPGIRTLARADGRAITDQDIVQSDKILRPSTKCEYVEAGMLYALVASILPKGNETREVALGLCRRVGKPGDAEFVYECDLGGRSGGSSLSVANRVRDLAYGYDGVEGADVLHSFITNSVKELKLRTKKKSVAIYPGRDVWCWEVMSKRQGMPSLYDPKVSRSIATNEHAIKKVIEPWQITDWEKTVLFDTGHEGTVPRAIGKAAGIQKMLVIMLSAVRNEEQIFRTHAKSRKKALACEYLAKYQKRASVRDNAPYQELADLEEFIKAALLTIWLWYHISPARLPSWRDKEVIKTMDGLRFSNNISIQTIPSVRWAPYVSQPINQAYFGSAAISGSVSNSPIYLTSSSASSATSTGLIDPTTSGTLDMFWGGSGTAIGGGSGTAIDTSMWYNAPSVGVTPTLGPGFLPVGPAGSNTNPEPVRAAKPAGLTTAPVDPAKVTSRDIVAYETAKLQAATADANLKAASKLADLKDQIPKIMAVSNAPPGQLPDVSFQITVDKDTGAVHKTVTYKSPLVASQPGGVPLPSSLPNPTTGRSTPPVTDGSGKVII